MRKLLQLALLSLLLAWCVPAQATFPAFAGACVNSTRTNNNTDDVANLPADIAAGDLILEFHFKDGAGTFTYPSPWEEIFDAQDGSGLSSYAIGYLIASGGETSVTVVSTHGERFTSIACRITAASWHGTTPPEASTGATAVNDTPDPDAVTASWGSDDNLFIAVAGADINGDVTGFPTSYDDNQTVSDATTSSAHGGIATRELAAASDDPGTFTLDASEDNIGMTVVVRGTGGAPPATAPPTQMMMGVGD